MSSVDVGYRKRIKKDFKMFRYLNLDCVSTACYSRELVIRGLMPGSDYNFSLEILTNLQQLALVSLNVDRPKVLSEIDVIYSIQGLKFRVRLGCGDCGRSSTVESFCYIM